VLCRCCGGRTPRVAEIELDAGWVCQAQRESMRQSAYGTLAHVAEQELRAG